MEQESTNRSVQRPPLRKFLVRIRDTDNDRTEDHEVTAHLVFDNSCRGEGLVFRRYYDDNVRTEKVAQFNNWDFYKELAND